MATTTIKISYNGEANNEDFYENCKQVASKVESELSVWCSSYDNSLLCEVEDKEKITDFLLENDIACL